MIIPSTIIIGRLALKIKTETSQKFSSVVISDKAKINPASRTERKPQANDVGKAIKDCLVIHGHVGYSEEYPLEQRLRDVLSYQIGDGTANIQKVIIVRDILGAQYGM